MATRSEETAILEDLLEEINVVPNPYYAYSQYETGKLDNRVKIVNLPSSAPCGFTTFKARSFARTKSTDP